LLASGESLEWAIVEKTNKQPVGSCGLHSFHEASGSAEVGCMLLRVAWGCGMMREALPALFDYARTLGIAELHTELCKVLRFVF
jgi:ribosomal-protein-alanine N-acetyltransferase